MRATIQATEAYRLSVDLKHTPHGHHLRLLSLVPIARHPEERVRFEGIFNTAELRALRRVIDAALLDERGLRLIR